MRLVYLVSACVGEGKPALDLERSQLQMQMLLSELIIDGDQALATTCVPSLLLRWRWSQQLRRRCAVESSCRNAAYRSLGATPWLPSPVSIPAGQGAKGEAVRLQFEVRSVIARWQLVALLRRPQRPKWFRPRRR